MRRLHRIVDGLIAHGKDPRTPSAVIARGTLPDAALAEGELRDLPDLAKDLPQPALVVIGDVVALRRELRHPLAAQA